MEEHPAGSPEAVDKTLPMGIENIGFMLERLGRDCDDLQFLRELTQNSLEAQATKIVWDADWTIWEASGGTVYKLCCIDNGRGMTPDQMVRYINNLSASAHLQAHDGNYGVGAKIAAASRNPAGLIYQSWSGGRGAMILLWRDPVTGDYGLRQFEWPDGRWDYWIPLSDKAKPKEITEHGTKVILLGKSEPHSTMEPPDGVATPSRWVGRYLNARYFTFPEGADVKAREGWTTEPSDTKRNVLRTVRGQKVFLDRHGTAKGVTDLSQARVHWWVLDESEARAKASELVNVGHFASLYRNELYELRTGRAGVTRLHQFGVIFGYDRVVLYVEPLDIEGFALSSNTSRTQLLRNGQPLPYADWAVEFRSKMPQEIRDHMDAVIAGARDASHREAIAERLQHYRRLYHLSRFRPRPEGRLSIAEPVIPRRRSPSVTDGIRNQADSEAVNRRPRQETLGRLLASMLAAEGEPGEATRPPEQHLPEVKWISEEDGTRAPGFLEDRAAKYIAEDNLIQANADFRVFTDMADYWCEEYELEQGSRVVVDVVEEWFEQALVETVLGCQSLQGEREWSPADIERALSEEALTAAVMQRYHVANSIKRTLGARLGSLKEKAGAS